MAIVTRKSTAIGNRDATPAVPTSASVARAIAKIAEGFVTVANGDSATSYYPMCSVPSNARVQAVSLVCANLGAASSINIGVFWPTVIPPLPPGVVFGGTVAPATQVGAAGATLFASAQATSAALAATDVTNQSGNNTVAIQEQELWQALGLSQDPGIDFDIAVQVQVAMAAAGALGIKVTYAN